MVKLKSQPKSRFEAGMAARTAEPVHDNTRNQDDGDNEPSASNSHSSSSSTSDSSPPQQRQSSPPKQLRGLQRVAEKGPVRPVTAAATATAASKATLGGNKTKLTKFSKPGTKTLKEIRKLQKTTHLLIPRAPFLRLTKELIMNRASDEMKITVTAVEALREASECFLTNMFEDSYLLSLHAKRVTLMPKDMNLLMRLKYNDLETC